MPHPTPDSDFECFLRRSLPCALAKIRRMLPKGPAVDPMSDEEDVLQEVYLKVLRHWRCWEPPTPEPPEPWLGTLIANTVRDALRARRAELRERARTQSLADHDPDDGRARMLCTLVECEDQHRLQRAVEELPDGERTAIRMYYIEGLTDREIGERLDLSPGGARKLRQRALARLRQRLCQRGSKT